VLSSSYYKPSDVHCNSVLGSLRESNSDNGRAQPEFQEANLESDGEINVDVGRGKITYTRFFVFFHFGEAS
jgi:hypothetical protein